MRHWAKNLSFRFLKNQRFKVLTSSSSVLHCAKQILNTDTCIIFVYALHWSTGHRSSLKPRFSHKIFCQTKLFHIKAIQTTLHRHNDDKWNIKMMMLLNSIVSSKNMNSYQISWLNWKQADLRKLEFPTKTIFFSFFIFPCKLFFVCVYNVKNKLISVFKFNCFECSHNRTASTQQSCCPTECRYW